MQYNGSLHEEDTFPYLETLVNQFYRVELFGCTDEDVCVHGNPAFLPDELNTDLVVYIRRGTPISQIVDGLLAVGIRAEEEGLE